MAYNEEVVLLKEAKSDLEWFNKNYSTFYKEYYNKFIGIKNGLVVGVGGSPKELIETLKTKQIDPALVLIQRIPTIPFIASVDL